MATACTYTKAEALHKIIKPIILKGENAI